MFYYLLRMTWEQAKGIRHKAVCHEPCAISQMSEPTETNLLYPGIFKICITIIRFLGPVVG